ncbi:hypothetical protein Lgee_2111 [Legionella geestiana]|uniref:Uncharacterized protein n=1 Tax=Legionella geestiana TaxID=45065 RepID=A0A0W0TNG6_9GAMM|nr:hypothetical protein [Legionella geestiana]KTC97140.1 hypothetical protein Lgee_2111 [Legionella geestiana]QBS11494.1 hypothetical protein E4T54_01345 [Legionella geestiana]STX53842.1 Uncharacterised protein [Legionella geestiana]
MSNISATTIPFKPSRRYRQLLVILHLFAGVILWRSSLATVLQAAGTVLLLLNGWFSRSRTFPHPEMAALSHREEGWTLHHHDGSTQTFQRLKVRLDGGFFWHLCLTSETASLRRVVFVDSLDIDARWRLRFMASTR